MALRASGPVYTGTVTAVAVTLAQDVFEILAPATTRVRIREIRIGQYSDAGDAQAELLSVLIITGYTTTGSGGSTLTPLRVDRSSTLAAASTVKANNTTVASAGTPLTIYSDTWNIQGGWWYAPSEAEMITLDLSQRLVVRITAPADSITTNATIVFEELGLMAV